MNKTVHYIGWVVHKETLVRLEKKTAEKTSGKFDRACSTTARFDAPSLRSVGQRWPWRLGGVVCILSRTEKPLPPSKGGESKKRQLE